MYNRLEDFPVSAMFQVRKEFIWSRVLVDDQDQILNIFAAYKCQVPLSIGWRVFRRKEFVNRNA